MIRIVGLGQRAAGDDGVGLLVADALAADPPGGCTVAALSDPSELVELCDGRGPVVLIDAVVGGGAVGAVRTVGPEALAHGPRALSSHGMGVPQALGLAEALHGPTPVRVVAVCIEGPPAVGDTMSPEVRRAVPEAVATARRVVAELRDA